MKENEPDPSLQESNLVEMKKQISEELSKLDKQIDQYDYRIKYIYNFHVPSFALAIGICGLLAAIFLSIQSPHFINFAGIAVMGYWILNTLKTILVKKPILDVYLK